MLSKNYFFIIIVSFFIAGLIFFALPNKAFSQMGCCQNPGGNCRPGQSADTNDDTCGGQAGPVCEDVCEFNGGDWYADELCTPGGPCPSAVLGCCDDFGMPDMCESGITLGECDVLGGDFEPGSIQCNAAAVGVDDVRAQVAVEGECGETPIDPLGCCESGSRPDDTTCRDFVTEAACVDRWVPGDFCFPAEGLEGFCGEPPPPPPPKPFSAIPTISQWGLIATAGIMALFSLFYMIRRKSYNA